MYGKNHSEETKKKMSDKKSGTNNPNSKYPQNIKDELFKMRDLGIDYKTIITNILKNFNVQLTIGYCTTAYARYLKNKNIKHFQEE